MTIWARIKLGAAIALAAIVGALYVMLGIRTSQRDKAESERDKAVEKAKSTEKRIEAHEKRQEIEQDIAIGDHPNTDGVRDPYDRSTRS